jgi:hypothetical protein
MPNTPTSSPAENVIKTTKTTGAVHWVPKKNRTVTSPWLFKAKAKSVKKMAALSIHLKSQTIWFIQFLGTWPILSIWPWF